MKCKHATGILWMHRAGKEQAFSHMLRSHRMHMIKLAACSTHEEDNTNRLLNDTCMQHDICMLQGHRMHKSAAPAKDTH